MIKYIVDRFFGWMTNEPFIGLMMVIAAVVLFLAAYKKGGGPLDGFWPWTRRILEAAGTAILFLGLLWAFRAVLNDNNQGFRRSHGRVSAANYSSLKTIWGAPHVQRELRVSHFIKKRIREEVPRPDPAARPIYKIVERNVRVEQNSILGSKGRADLKLNKRKKGSAYYSGFEIAFQMEYMVVNDSRETTEARFTFPLNGAQAQFKNLKITRDGKDLSRDLRVARNAIRWTQRMRPGEKQKIAVQYESRGVEQFYYQIPSPREIRDFSLVLTVDKLPVGDVNYPRGCITPDSKKAGPDGKGTELTWNLNRAITTAGMGIALPKPEQPGAKVSLVLSKSPYALMLLVVSIALTLMILGKGVNFLEIALLSAVYCVLFITMASVSDFFMGFWGSLILGAALTLGLAYLLYRRNESLMIRRIILILTGFFSLVYPLAGLFPDFQESFDGIVVVGLIIYLFWISLYSRLGAKGEAIQS